MVELLKNQRAYVKGRITYFYNNVSKEQMNKFQLNTIENHIKTLYAKYETLQDKIENADETEITKKDREEFDNQFCNLEVLIMQKQFELSEVEDQENDQKENINGGIGYVPKCRLPELDLPKFDGNYSSWLSFKDDFENLIHKNETIDNVDKFRYLISCIRDGEAYSIIEFLPRTAINYPVAWQRLLESFDNDVVVKINYMADIYDISPVQEGSVSSLQSFIDNFLKYFNALKALQIDVSTWDLFLVHHLMRKLDYRTKAEVQSKSSVNELMTVDQLMKILTDRCRFMRAMSQPSSVKNTKSHSSNSLQKRDRFGKPVKNHSMVITSFKCASCLQSDHLIYKCPKFLSQTPQERFDVVKKRKLCLNCLNVNHVWQKCQSKFNCRICDKRHHILLHRDTSNSKINIPPQSNNDSVNPSNSTSVNATEAETSTHGNSSKQTFSFTGIHLADSKPQKHRKQVLIATAIVLVSDGNGNRIPCQLILDSGSQVNFISEQFSKKLSIKRKFCNFKIAGIGELTANSQQAVTLSIFSRVSNFSSTLDFIILPKIITELPSFSFDFDRSKLPINFELADPYFNKTDKIDMLLGAEIYFDIVMSEKRSIINGLPPFQQSQLGFIVSGKMESEEEDTYHDVQHGVSFVATLDELNINVQRFWSLESIESQSTYSIEEKECEQHYADHVQREVDGRYCVRLPTKSNLSELGQSKFQAQQQFLRLEQRLSNNYEMKQQYIKFMAEYLNLNHMELSPEDKSSINHEYFLPHHCVSRPSSESTKFRVVFNGSFQTSSKLSLNDVLKVGPTIQQDLFSILVRFRKHKYAFTGDIVKMYRQVNVYEPDRNLQKIWWRNSSDQPLSIYRLCTVTYGTACAPYLAVRTLKQLALDDKNQFPIASEVLLTDFYVDDVLTGEDDVISARNLQKELIELLAHGGFQLSKFSSNFPLYESENSTPLNANEEMNIALLNTESKHVLGVNWDTSRDLFSIPLISSIENTDILPTKRSCLSQITKLFDPMGICAPIVFYAKCFIQKLWSDPEIGWDSELPTTLAEEWIKFRFELCEVKTISIPRCVLSSKSISFSLHGFGDASEKGFGCCIYNIVNCRWTYVILSIMLKIKSCPFEKTNDTKTGVVCVRIIEPINAKGCQLYENEI